MATALDQLYPMSTEDGESIPLDIIRPLDVQVVAFAAESHTPVNFTAGQKYCSVSSTVDCVVDLTNSQTYPLASSTSGFVVCADAVYTIQLPEAPVTARIIPLNPAEAGSFRVTGIQKWAGIGLARQLNQR